MITVATLFSGSSGNSTLIKTERAAVLVDCGRNCKTVCASLAALGMDICDISAIFITHEHRDHISALDVMMRKRKIPIHITAPSAAGVCAGVSAAQNAVIHKGILFEERVGDITVKSFPLPHDSAAHVGYVIHSDAGDSAGVATDMGYATMEAFNMLSGCRQIVVEANHDVEMLQNGPYPYYLKERILSPRGHLSNTNCAALCAGLAEKGTQAFMLAHLSDENNSPDIAYNTVKNALCDKTVKLAVAKRNCATAL